MQVWNPSFDVTPADLITGIITEEGMVPKTSQGAFNVSAVATKHETVGANGTKHSKRDDSGSDIPGFYALDVDTVKDYLAERPNLCKLLGSPDSKAEWKVRIACAREPISSIHICARSPVVNSLYLFSSA